MDLVDPASASRPRSRRRRSRGRERPPPPAWLRFYQGWRFLALMAVATAAWVALSARSLAAVPTAYGDVVIGWGRPDLLYGFGRPLRTETLPRGAVLWHQRNGWRMATTVGEQGVESINCLPQAGGGCPAVLGVGTGAGESDVWRSLGPPDRVRFDGGYKLLSYDDLGLTLRLRGFRVEAISIGPATGGTLDLVGRWLHVALP